MFEKIARLAEITYNKQDLNEGGQQALEAYTAGLLEGFGYQTDYEFKKTASKLGNHLALGLVCSILRPGNRSL